MKFSLRKTLLAAATTLVVAAASGTAYIFIADFSQTTHATVISTFGKPVSLSAMEALIGTPGPLEVETIASADYVADLSGLINLDDPRAVKAGLKDRKEPIEIYAHVLRHPTHGMFIVDTGVSKKFVADPKTLGVGWVVRKFANIDKMKIKTDTSSIIASEGAPLRGVFLTHLHLDHISGMPDIPVDTPFYTGPGEAKEQKLENFFVQDMIDRFFEGRPAIQELQFTKDPDGKFAGLIDVFGDASLFAIQTSGHTEGHISFLARTTSGSVLLTGDACHTRWGWENGVEPGSFTFDRERERASLAALTTLSQRHPNMEVRLGHQPM